jgi:hypothetical protein
LSLSPKILVPPLLEHILASVFCVSLTGYECNIFHSFSL